MIIHDPEDPRCMCNECKAAREEQEDRLVAQASITKLADLYKRGRQQGLLRPQRSYN